MKNDLIPFKEILKNKNNLTVIMPSEPLEILDIIPYLVNWLSFFKKITLLFGKHSYAFFSKILDSYSFHSQLLTAKCEISEGSIVLDLCCCSNFKSFCKKADQCIFVGNSPSANLILSPSKDDGTGLLANFADFLQLPFFQAVMNWSLDSLKDTAVSKLAEESKKPIIAINLNKTQNRLKIDRSFLRNLKLKGNGTIINLGKTLFPFLLFEVTNIKNPDLFKLYLVANLADFFINDDNQLMKLLVYFNVKNLYAGKRESTELPNPAELVNPADFSESIKLF